MRRRDFLGLTAATLLAPHLPLRAAAATPTPVAPTAMTVRGPVPGARLGRVLPHEHVLVDFIGAYQVSSARYAAAAAFRAFALRDI